MFPSVSGRLVVLCIMAGMDQKGFFKFVDIHGSCMCRVGFTGYVAPRVMFPSGVVRPKMLRILAGMAFSRLVLLVTIPRSPAHEARHHGRYFPEGQSAPRAFFSFLVRRPMMLDIISVLDQKYSYCGMYNAVLLMTMHLSLCSWLAGP